MRSGSSSSSECMILCCRLVIGADVTEVLLDVFFCMFPLRLRVFVLGYVHFSFDVLFCMFSLRLHVFVLGYVRFPASSRW